MALLRLDAKDRTALLDTPEGSRGYIFSVNVYGEEHSIGVHHIGPANNYSDGFSDTEIKLFGTLKLSDIGIIPYVHRPKTGENDKSTRAAITREAITLGCITEGTLFKQFAHISDGEIEFLEMFTGSYSGGRRTFDVNRQGYALTMENAPWVQKGVKSEKQEGKKALERILTQLGHVQHGFQRD